MHFPIIIILSLSASCFAETVTLTLSSTADYALKHNPQLAAARFQIEEAKGRLLQSGRLANPEIGFEFNHDQRFGEGGLELSFEQRFPLTSRLHLEKSLSGKAVAAAELEIKDTERKLSAATQSLAIKLLSLEQQKTLRLKQAELANKLADFATKRAEKGELSSLDAAQALVDSQRILLESRQFEMERISLGGELKTMLGLSAKQTLNITGQLPALTSKSEVLSLEQRPDYQLSKLQEDAARVSIDLAKAKKWEDIKAEVFVQGERKEDEPVGLTQAGFIGFRFKLPLPFWNKNKGEILEKTASAQRAQLETKALVNEIGNEASTAHSEMLSYAKLVGDTKDKLLPLVIQQTEKLEKAYEQGQTDLLTILRAREQRLQIEASALNATRDFHLARIRYEAATGK